MARDRKRAKQRRDRAAAKAAGPLSPSQPVRTEVPGALDHASGEADEFEAAIVRGGGGVPVPDADVESAAAGADDDELLEQPLGGEPADERDNDDLLQERPDTAAGGGGARRDGGGGHAVAERPSGAPLRGGNRAIGFLRASWAELQRVQWPDRRQVTQATAVVLGFVVVAGAYLGLADFVAKEVVEAIL